MTSKTEFLTAARRHLISGGVKCLRSSISAVLQSSKKLMLHTTPRLRKEKYTSTFTPAHCTILKEKVSLSPGERLCGICKQAPLASWAKQKRYSNIEPEPIALCTDNAVWSSNASVRACMSEESSQHQHSSTSQVLQTMKCWSTSHSQYYTVNWEEFRALNINYIDRALRESISPQTQKSLIGIQV